MTKQDYLRILEYNLRGLRYEEIKDILSDYEEHFYNGRANGKTDDEISASLGDPILQAQQYLNNKSTQTNFENEKNTFVNKDKDSAIKNIFIVIGLIFLAILVGPLAFGLLTAAIAIIFAMLVVVIVVPFSLGIAALSVFAVSIISIPSTTPLFVLLMLLIAVFCASTCALLFTLVAKLLKIVLPKVWRGLKSAFNAIKKYVFHIKSKI